MIRSVNELDALLATIPEPTDNRRIVVAMSGGVDSSVSAWLLKERGWEPVGVFMRNGIQHRDPATYSKGCCGIEDALDARRVCDELAMPFYAANFEQDFKRIIDDFVDEYNAGRTPNPCVQCNRLLKFGVLLEYARALDAARIATGHYARLVFENGRHALVAGSDPDKDQSYVLFNLSQEQLSWTVLPIGAFAKPYIRELARRMNLRVHDKKDSVEICFVPQDNYRLVLQERSPGRIRPGRFVDTRGAVLGEHGGHQLFTIGQRKGLGAFGKPMYVKTIDAASNTVMLAEDAGLLQTELTADRLNWVAWSPEQVVDGARVRAKIRYRHEPRPARLEWTSPECLRVVFDEEQRAITPGQAVVFYDDADRVLGGGWIR